MQNYDHDYGRIWEGEKTIQDAQVSFLLDEMESLLKGRQLEVFKLIRQGFSAPQIAHLLEISSSSVRTLIERFRKTLRKKYDKIDLKNHSMADYLSGAC